MQHVADFYIANEEQHFLFIFLLISSTQTLTNPPWTNCNKSYTVTKFLCVQCTAYTCHIKQNYIHSQKTPGLLQYFRITLPKLTGKWLSIILSRLPSDYGWENWCGFITTCTVSTATVAPLQTTDKLSRSRDRWSLGWLWTRQQTSGTNDFRPTSRLKHSG